MSDIARMLFGKTGMAPTQLMGLTPGEFAELLLEKEQTEPDYEPGTLGHLVRVNAKLTAKGLTPTAPGWLWPEVPSNRMGMKPPKRASRG